MPPLLCRSQHPCEDGHDDREVFKLRPRRTNTPGRQPSPTNLHQNLEIHPFEHTSTQSLRRRIFAIVLRSTPSNTPAPNPRAADGELAGATTNGEGKTKLARHSRRRRLADQTEEPRTHGIQGSMRNKTTSQSVTATYGQET